MNLIDNAIKYNNVGGAIYIQLLSQDDLIILNICDSGIGVSTQDQPFIFERYYRSDLSR